jgi:outer membrane scaffolding protein for murein synthesis (MipA/OmpV family)
MVLTFVFKLEVNIMSSEKLQRMFSYLDNLKKSGTVNMMWSSKYLEYMFGVNSAEAKRVLLQWMSK